MPEKSPIEKIHHSVTGAVLGAVADPGGTATKVAQQARGVAALGFMAVGQVAQTIADRLMKPPPAPTPSAPRAPVPAPRDKPTPADVARVVEMKPPPKPRPKPAPKPAAKAAPATPSAKLPPRKAPAKKAPPKKAPTKQPPAGTEA